MKKAYDAHTLYREHYHEKSTWYGLYQQMIAPPFTIRCQENLPLCIPASTQIGSH
jgi:hypothetical protein